MCQRNTNSSFKADCWHGMGQGHRHWGAFAKESLPWILAGKKNTKCLAWFVSQISSLIHISKGEEFPIYLTATSMPYLFRENACKRYL